MYILFDRLNTEPAIKPGQFNPWPVFLVRYTSHSHPPPPRPNQGGRAQHDFSLAWLEAAWYFSESGQVQLQTSRFKKGCVKCVVLYYPRTEFERTFNVYWNVIWAARLSCSELSIWEFPFLRGGCRQGGTVYDNVWMGCPRRTLWTMLCTPECFRILSTSLTSVSIFFSCW